jgi:quercetin dioxygenase-like cupin family protein
VRPSATPTVQIDNERVLITAGRFAPGAATGSHRHAHDCMMVPMTTGRLTHAESGGTTRESHLSAGVSYLRPAGVEYDVINDNDFEFVFVEIEMKSS